MFPLNRTIKRSLPIIAILIFPIFFVACGGPATPLIGGAAGSFPFGGPGGFGSGQQNPGTAIDVTGQGNSQVDREAAKRLEQQCTRLGDVAFDFLENCGRLVEELARPSLIEQDQAVLQLFRNVAGPAFNAIQPLYSPFCGQQFFGVLQNAVTVSVGAFKQAPWQQIFSVITNAQSVHSLARSCASDLQTLGR